MMDSNRATLLGLPTELRLRIYDYVLSFDIGRLAIYDPAFPAGHEWRFKYEGLWNPKDGLGTRIIRHDASLPRISWLSLLSTCSTIREELKGHMSSPAAAVAAPVPPSAKQDDENDKAAIDPCHTYELHITASRKELSGVVFLSLPCPPTECRQLTAYITLPGDVEFSDPEDVQTSSLRESYQTLNRFLHCGPMLDARTPLRTGPMTLETLAVVVEVEAGTGSDGQATVGRDERREVRENLAFVYWMLLETGVLRGLVERVRSQVVGCEDDEGRSRVEEWVVKDYGEVHCGKLPDEWVRNGYEWGVAANGAG